MSPSDIAISHRTGKMHPDKPRPIVARITNHRAKMFLLRNAKYLKSKPELAGISINQELTKLRSTIAYQCRLIVRREKMNATWVVDGKIYITDKKDLRYTIRTMDDFEEMLSICGIDLGSLDPEDDQDTEPKQTEGNNDDDMYA